LAGPPLPGSPAGSASSVSGRTPGCAGPSPRGEWVHRDGVLPTYGIADLLDRPPPATPPAPVPYADYLAAAREIFASAPAAGPSDGPGPADRLHRLGLP
jgi:hypothetical protein